MEIKIYKCECGKEFYKANSLNAHYSHCNTHKIAINSELSPNRIKGANKGKMNGWEKFTDKEKQEIYKKSSETLKNKYKNTKSGPFSGKTHSNETKEKIRKKRVEFLSDGKQHGSFKNGEKSYLEKWFDNFLVKHNFYNQFNIKYNLNVYPYFLDYAFIDLKIDFELDGTFHYLNESNIIHDKKRNSYLETLGWKIFRISYDEIYNNSKEVENEIINYLKNFSESSLSRYY